MEQKIRTRRTRRATRQRRIRARITGTASMPRLSVFRSATGISAALIDDVTGRTLLAVQSKMASAKSSSSGDRKAKVLKAYETGLLLGQKAVAQGISHVVFDRGGYAYHGRVQALAEGAREGGLIF